MGNKGWYGINQTNGRPVVLEAEILEDYKKQVRKAIKK